jgi:hypothetical protein
MKNPSKTIVLKSKNWHLASLMVVMTISVAILFVVFSRRLARIYKDDAESSSVITSAIGQTASNGVFEITVSDMKKAGSIQNYFEPTADEQPICLPVKIKNVSGSEKKFIPIEEIRLVGDDNQSYTIDFVPSCIGGVGGPLQTGEEMSGELGFILPNFQNNQSRKVYKFEYKTIDKNLKSVIIPGIYSSDMVVD